MEHGGGKTPSEFYENFYIGDFIEVLEIKKIQAEEQKKAAQRNK